MTTFYEGHALDILRALPSGSARTCVTSPPYYSLRDYSLPPSTWGDGWLGCLGAEDTPWQYVAHLAEVFREVRRVLTDDGTLWLNLGDSYAGSGRGPTGKNGIGNQGKRQGFTDHGARTYDGIKAKDLIGIPWMVAFALRADGWYLRQDIVWAKPNPMPESVRDRCTRSHEYIFMLSKQARYYYGADAVKEPCVTADDPRNRPDYKPRRSRNVGGRTDGLTTSSGCLTFPSGGRNKRDVWTVPTRGYPGAHFATFPPKLIEPCILAGSAVGDTILDPFGGSGTTSLVARDLGRHSIYIDQSAEYAEMARQRLALPHTHNV